MSGLALGMTLLGGSIALIFLRVPIGAAMFSSGAAGFLYIVGPDPLLGWLKSLVYARLSNFDLIVIPLFLMMGQFATNGGLSRLLFHFMRVSFGHWRGGVALATVGACGGFGAICGSSIATVTTMGSVAYPEMRRLGYSGRLSTATIAAGGTLGILIPPSVPLVVYAILTGASIGKLFVASILPAVLAFCGYMLAVYWQCLRDPAAGPALDRAPFKEWLTSFASVVPITLIFAVVVIGIYGGWASPTEASAIGAVATAIIAFSNGMRLAGFVQSLIETAQSTAMILLILLGADMLNAALAFTNMTNDIAAWIAASGFAPLLVVGVIVALYILLGCVMESMSMIMLTVPIFYPLVMSLDFPGMTPEQVSIWFGILALMVVEIGLITPPIGINVFVVNRLARDVPLQETFRGVVPFLVADAVRILMVMFVPASALWLVYG